MRQALPVCIHSEVLLLPGGRMLLRLTGATRMVMTIFILFQPSLSAASPAIVLY